MSELRRIHSQVRRSFEGEAWHGPSVKETLTGVTAAQAAKHPLAGAHSIWELVLHIERWARAVSEALGGTPMPQPPFAEDWPAVGGTSEKDWQAALAKLDAVQAGLLSAIKGFPEERLREVVPGRHGYDYAFLLYGLVQHNIYHAGQIALLKKA